jgi:hypothetical protein
VSFLDRFELLMREANLVGGGYTERQLRELCLQFFSEGFNEGRKERDEMTQLETMIRGHIEAMRPMLDLWHRKYFT